MNVTVESKSAGRMLASVPIYGFFLRPEDRLYLRLPDCQGVGQALYFGDGGEPIRVSIDLNHPGLVLAEVDIVARPE